MCVILDANVVHEVFGSNRPPAGKEFFDWINRGKASAHLIIGGKLSRELGKGSTGFRTWALEAQQAGRLIPVDDGKVNAKTEELERDGTCRSNDTHVIALAQIGRVRLLYSNDRDLQDDFKDKALIDRPRGKVYSTGVNEEFTDAHKRLLQRAYCAPRR